MLLRGAYGLSLRSLIGRHLLQWTASPWTTEASTRKRVKRITIIRLWWLSQWLVTHGHHPAVTIYLHVAPSSGRHRHIWNRHVQPSRRRCHSWEQQDRPYNFCRQYGTSDSVTRVTLRKMVTRLDSCFSQNASNHINESRLESESFLQYLWVPDGQTQIVCIQRNGQFLLQWWSRLAEIFCFACLVLLRCILRIKCPQLAKRETWHFAFSEGSARHNILTPYRGLMQYLHIVIMVVGLYCGLDSFPDTSKVICGLDSFPDTRYQ